MVVSVLCLCRAPDRQVCLALARPGVARAPRACLAHHSMWYLASPARSRDLEGGQGLIGGKAPRVKNAFQSLQLCIFSCQCWGRLPQHLLSILFPETPSMVFAFRPTARPGRGCQPAHRGEQLLFGAWSSPGTVGEVTRGLRASCYWLCF